MAKKHIYLLFLVICPVLPGCDSNKDNTHTNDSLDLRQDTVAFADSLQLKYRSLIQNLPAPVEMLRNITGSGMKYRDSLINFPENVSRYSKSNTQAINLGIYGADLSYLIAMEQFGQVGPYIRSVKKLADVIVIPSVFDANTMGQYDKNRNNGDTLQNIIYQSYKKIDVTLQDNQRLGLATLVVTGSWIEAMYITTQHIEKEGPSDKKGKPLNDILIHQKIHLKSLSELAGNFNNDPFFAELKTSLSDLADVFPDNGLPDADHLKIITTKVASLRNRIVKME